jgi:hypothetical protein
VKRITVHIFGAAEFAVALSLCRFLKHNGIDAVLVTKHAVQVHPDQVQKTATVVPAYRWGWDRPPESAR